MNDAMVQFLGVQSKEVILGHFNVRQSGLIPGSDLSPFVERAFNGEVVDIPTFSFDPRKFEEERSDGSLERAIHARLFPVFDRNDRLVNVVAMFEDVTDKQKLEEQLFQSQKMESIGLLAGGIAHDFNNILGGILGYASYLKTGINKDEKIYAHLETIERSALRAAELTSKLLAFARGGKYNVRPIDVNSVVDETLRLLRGSFDKSIMIEEALTKPLPSVEADAGQLQQVLMNLCVNARDAMPGGGRLVVRTTVLDEPDDFLRAQPTIRPQKYVCATVADSGVGIDRVIISRIFEPFFTTKEKGKGTGLGLATVYGIVKNHSGFIDVQSEIGTGTTFTVYLPAVAEKAVSIDQGPRTARGGRETILIVDDEDMIRMLAKDLLGSKGYTVLEACNGPDALRMYAADGARIDLVILDMAMPGMDGREVFDRLKDQNPNVRTILSTGYAEDDRAREMMSQGVRAFVQKPYRAEEFAAAVRRVLDEPK
jgi:signal transduction histidine kinase/ActR/RegA family two-component response regulator